MDMQRTKYFRAVVVTESSTECEMMQIHVEKTHDFVVWGNSFFLFLSSSASFLFLDSSPYAPANLHRFPEYNTRVKTQDTDFTN